MCATAIRLVRAHGSVRRRPPFAGKGPSTRSIPERVPSRFAVRRSHAGVRAGAGSISMRTRAASKAGPGLMDATVLTPDPGALCRVFGRVEIAPLDEAEVGLTAAIAV